MTPTRRGQFRFAPIPRYSTTTRNGTQVSCMGCCLPLPLGCLTTVVAVGVPMTAAAVRRFRERR